MFVRGFAIGIFISRTRTGDGFFAQGDSFRTYQLSYLLYLDTDQINNKQIRIFYSLLGIFIQLLFPVLVETMLETLENERIQGTELETCGILVLALIYASKQAKQYAWKCL